MASQAPSRSPAAVGALAPASTPRPRIWLADLGGDHHHVGAGRDQALDLAGRHRAAADHHAAPAFDDEVDRIEDVGDRHAGAAYAPAAGDQPPGLLLLVEAQDLQLDAEVDLAQGHVGRDRHRRRERS